MAFKKLGVIFTNKALETKNGQKYYSGKLEGTDEFNIMAFVNTSKNGTKYLSLVEVTQDNNYSGGQQSQPSQNNQYDRKNRRSQQNQQQDEIDPDDLPF